MIETTMRLVIDDTVPGDMRGHYLYLVRHDDVIFYVGRSTDPILRMHQHLDLVPYGFYGHWNSYGCDALGRLITACKPESDAWNVAFFTLEDVRLKETPVEMLYYYLDIAERALIMAFQPCMNAHHRNYQVGLPEKYTRRVEAFYTGKELNTI